MRCTIKDVARLANTSTATVSLVLNSRPGVNKDTKKRVLDAIEKLNYQPNQIARSLINQKTNMIGLVVSDIFNPFYGELAYNMQKETEQHDMNLTLGISNNKVTNEKQIVESMMKRGVDGIVLVPARDGEGDLQHLYKLQEMGIPLVFITSRYQGIRADTVMTDLEQATFELVDYLIDSGEKNIIFVGEKRSLLHVERRISGFQKAFHKHGLFFGEENVIEVDPDVENGVLVTRNRILRKKPDSIVAINAFTAIGIMKELRDNNIAIPGQVSVSCFDDLDYASILYTPLTVVKQPIEEMCREAVGLLKEGSKRDSDNIVEKLLKGELIIRDSTK